MNAIRLAMFLFGFALVVVGYPYGAVVANVALGTFTTTYVDGYGVRQTSTIGRDAPLPAWLPMLPDSTVVSAAHFVPHPPVEASGRLEILTRSEPQQISAFYLERLRSLGFKAQALSADPLSTAEALIGGEKPAGSLSIKIAIGRPHGLLLRARAVNILWGKWDRPVPAATVH